MNRWTWRVCLLLLLATALSYLDRQALSVVAPRVQAELQLDNAQLGTLLSAFFWAYAAFHIPVGWLLDRTNIRFAYGLFVALWSVAQIACGLMTGFGSLMAARFALGTFEAAGQVGAARVLQRVVPQTDRAFANGIMMSGGSIGAVIAPVLMIWLANQFGWRQGFVALGAVGLIWAAVWLWWFRPPREVLYGSGPATRGWGPLLRNPQFWACAAGAAFTIPIIHIGSAWLPTYFVQRWNLPLGSALSAYLFVIYLGLDTGFLAGGALTRWMARHMGSAVAARRRMLWLSAGCMLAAAAVPWASGPWIAVALVFIMNAGRASWGALFLSCNQEIDPARVGLVAGAMGSIGALSGAWLVKQIGVVSKTSGFDLPFLLIAALAVLGTLPVALAPWRDTAK